IRVAERDDEAGVNARLGSVVEKAATLGCIVERPAERVHDFARPVQSRIDLPDLLEAQTEMRRIHSGAQRGTLLEAPAERAAAPRGDHDAAREQRVTELESGLVRAIARDTEAARHDARHAAVLDQ